MTTTTRSDLRMGIRALANGWKIPDQKLRELETGAVELSIVGTGRQRATAKLFLDHLAKSGRTDVISEVNSQTKEHVDRAPVEAASRGQLGRGTRSIAEPTEQPRTPL